MAMVSRPSVLAATEGGVLLRLHVQPGAKAERLGGVHDNWLQLRLAAPPVNGPANAACLAFLAKTMGARRSWITLRSGRRSRHKVIRIEGLNLHQAAAILGIFHSTA